MNIDEPIAPAADIDLTPPVAFPGWPELFGLTAAVMPFLAGVVVDSRDVLAIGCGATAMLLGLVGLLLVGRRTEPHLRSKRLIAAVVLLALGAFHSMG